MLSPGKHRLLLVTDEQFMQVRNSYGVTRESLERDVDVLISWYITQPHLPQIALDREWLERLFIINKCSLEKTKQRLDMIFMSRNTIPEFFINRDPVKICKLGRLTTFGVPLRKLSSDNTRILMGKFFSSDTKYFDVMDMLNGMCMINEYRQYHDYAVGDRYICDTRLQTLFHILKMYPRSLKKGEYVNRKVFGNRIACIHLLFPNVFVKHFIRVIQMVLPAKIAKRIMIHPTLESLHEIIPREILPKDYGGDEVPLEELMDEWIEELCSERYKKWLKDQEFIKSDETKRIKKTDCFPNNAFNE